MAAVTPARLRTQLRNAGRRKRVLIRVFALGFDGSDGEKLGEWELDEPTDERRDEVSGDIFATVQNDCDVRGVDCKYRCRMTGTDGEELKTWSMKQRPDPAEAPGDDEGPLDTPNASGLVALALRHSESSVKLLLSNAHQTIRMQEQQIANLQRELDRSRGRELEVMDLFRTLNARVTEDRDAERNGERLDRAVELITRFASAVGQELGALPKGFDVFAEPAAANTNDRPVTTTALAKDPH